MTLLSADQILSANDRGAETVDVAEWNGAVLIGVMSGAARDALMSAAMREGGMPVGEYQALLLSLTIVDAAGNALFTGDQVKQLQDKSKDVLDRLAAVATRLNGIGAKAAEDVAKNSEAAPSGDSGSGSPSPTASPSDSSSDKLIQESSPS
jgi:hypothetical protein